MKKIHSILLLAIMAVATLTSCEKDYAIIFPTWKGFLIENKTLSTGDTLKVKAIIDQVGDYLYGPKYTWTFTLDTLSREDGVTVKPCKITYIKESKPDSYEVNEKGELIMHNNHVSINDDAEGRFVIPANAVASDVLRSITFSVIYNNSIDAKEMTEHKSSTQEGYEGSTFYYRIKSMLISETSNSFTTRIKIQ